MFELYLKKRLLDFFFKIINIHSFRSRMSIADAFISFSNFVHINLDNHKQVIGTFLDIKKSFDCVDHTILTEKLNLYGIKGE